MSLFSGTRPAFQTPGNKSGSGDHGPPRGIAWGGFLGVVLSRGRGLTPIIFCFPLIGAVGSPSWPAVFGPWTAPQSNRIPRMPFPMGPSSVDRPARSARYFRKSLLRPAGNMREIGKAPAWSISARPSPVLRHPSAACDGPRTAIPSLGAKATAQVRGSPLPTSVFAPNRPSPRVGLQIRRPSLVVLSKNPRPFQTLASQALESPTRIPDRTADAFRGGPRWAIDGQSSLSAGSPTTAAKGPSEGPSHNRSKRPWGPASRGIAPGPGFRPPRPREVNEESTGRIPAVFVGARSTWGGHVLNSRFDAMGLARREDRRSRFGPARRAATA